MFNHAVKYLAWCVNTDGKTKTDWLKLTDNNGSNACITTRLDINGHTHLNVTGLYSNYIQPYQHFNGHLSKGINVYSFCLIPEDNQPSGSLNMSRIDDASLIIQLAAQHDTITVERLINSNARIYVYAVNYNVLRIISGMAGVAYSN